MKNLIAIILVVFTIVGINYARMSDSNDTQNPQRATHNSQFITQNSKYPPSVSEPNFSRNLSDTIDIDEEMRKLEAEMKVWEEKMKPYEAEMKVWEEKMKPYQAEMKAWEEKMKPYEEQMRDLEKRMKAAESNEVRSKIGDNMSVIGDKMGDIGNEMGKVGDKMGKIGDEMGKVGDKMGEIGNEMGKVGDKMGKIGDEMGKVGDKMGKIGELMGERNKKIFSWFFHELKREGLLTDSKCSIFMENNVLVVNGKTLNGEQYDKYKKGIEARLGKPLKSGFSFYLKGTISNITEESFDFNGNMSTNY
jgi:hypothetical protein